MLAPVIIIASVVLRNAAGKDAAGKRPPLMPVFVIGFIVLATLNSLVALPQGLLNLAANASGWLLLTSIAAVGLKTRPAQVLKVGRSAAAVLILETVFLAILVALALSLLPFPTTAPF
jgi:uncharacterized membrane protein YadS